MDLYQFYSYDTPGVKTGPIPGVISWNNSNREGRIHFVGKLTQVSDSGPSWPSCLFKFLLFNAFPHSPEGSGERLQGHFGPLVCLILMKLSQSVCLNDISNNFEIHLVGLKIRLLGQIFEKACEGSRGHFFSLIFMKHGQNVSSMVSQICL